MNIIKYRAFVEAVRYGSLTLAAEALDYTQSGISHMISAMENEYGFPLLYRSKTGVTPTENGKRLFEYCARIVEIEDELSSTVQQLNGLMTGKLRIGAFLSVLLRWMPSVIERFSEQYPNIELQLFEGEINEQLTMLETGQIDLGFLSGAPPEGYKFFPICKDELVIILPHGHSLAQKPTISRHDVLLNQNSLILQHSSANEDLRLLFGDDAIPIQNKYSIRSDSTIIAMVEKGFGIAVVPKLLLSGQDGPNVEIRSLEAPCFRTLGIVIPDFKAPLPVVKCFKDVVYELFGE